MPKVGASSSASYFASKSTELPESSIGEKSSRPGMWHVDASRFDPFRGPVSAHERGAERSVNFEVEQQ